MQVHRSLRSLHAALQGPRARLVRVVFKHPSIRSGSLSKRWNSISQLRCLRNRMNTSNGLSDSTPPKQDPSQPLHRHLVLMFDGTGNQRLNLSNVARMFEAIDDSKPEEYVPYTKVGPSEEPVLEPEQQPLQLLKYIKGVGTDVLGHFSGLGFGFGLSANVIAGYVWLSNNYREGDKIFVFGFSRGAFSARSLVSLVHRCGGVLKNGSISANNEPELQAEDPVVVKAYDMYQAYVQTTNVDGQEKKDSAPKKVFYNAWQDFTSTAKKASFRIHRVTVKMLGVWDTVGAVGIPESGITPLDNAVYAFSRYSSKQYQFRDQGLSCIVENAYHALAIDEHRWHFAPTLWDKVTKQNQEVKQVWFVGSHCNVGGGADMDDFKDPDDLWQYSYVWMQKHAIKNGLRFYWTYDSPRTQSRSSEGTPVPTRRVSLRETEDSYGPFLGGKYKRLYDPFYRKAIETNGAKLHWSVTDRIALSIKRGDYYYPKSLFGKYGTQFTKVEPDMVEFNKLDIETPDLVKKTLWQIETDDAVELETSKPLHRLPVTECGCGHEMVAPEKQTGIWSWLGF